METAVVRTFDNYFSAHILKTKLEDAGIECYIFDENTVTVIPYLGRAVGQIKLVVNKSDLVNTSELIKQFDKEYLENTICPKCETGSFIVVPKKSAGNILTAIFSWMFSSFAVSATNVYQCNNCGYETESLPEDQAINN